RATREARSEPGEDRGADDDAERVGADDVPARGHADADAAGDLGQQAHGHELGRADGEAAERERDEREPQPPLGRARRARQARSGGADTLVGAAAPLEPVVVVAEAAGARELQLGRYGVD